MNILTCDACGYERSNNDDGLMFAESDENPDVLYCSICWEDAEERTHGVG